MSRGDRVVVVASVQPIGDRVYYLWCIDDNELVVRLRKNNFKDMTVVEQILEIREEVCAYACKYRDEASNLYSEDMMKKLYIQRYCHECPLMKLHFKKEKRHGS